MGRDTFWTLAHLLDLEGGAQDLDGDGAELDAEGPPRDVGDVEPSAPARDLHHLAFRVSAPDYDDLQRRFDAEGIEVRGGVHPVLKGVTTFYVDDPDGNECECIANDLSHPNSAKAG